MKQTDMFANYNKMSAIVLSFLLTFATLCIGCNKPSDNSENDTNSPNASDGGDVVEVTDVSATDTVQEYDTTPACVSEIDPSLAQADADGLFYADHVPVFDIYLPADKWEELQENAMDELYTEAVACFDGQRIGTVGLRFKGAHGTLYACFDENEELTCPRLSMKLKFNEYVEEQRFFGLKRLNFHANRYDDSCMKERLAYDLFRSMGISSPRASWAVVRVNDQSYGLYGMVEQIDGRFTNNRWPENPDGNLYKEIWPGDTDVDDIIYGLRTNEEEPDVSGFLAFSEAIVAAEDAAVFSTMQKFTGLTQWYRFLAVEDAIASYDGSTYFWTDGTNTHNHNYYIYESSPGHFTLIPWDVESTFWINPNHAAPHWTEIPEDCSLNYEYWGGLATAPACNRIFRALNTDLSGWRTAARELLDGPFALETMLENVDQYEAFIGDEARAEETPTMYTSFDGAVADIRKTIPNLRDRVEELIAEEGQ